MTRSLLTDGPFVVPRRSVVGRLAWYIVRVTRSPDDIKTIRDWAAYLGVSYSGLSETCRLACLKPHEVRDFARVLRALVEGERQRCDFELLLDISDQRTLRALVHRSGLVHRPRVTPASVAGFLTSQSFIAPSHPTVSIVANLLGNSPT